MASKVVQLQSKATGASQFVMKHGFAYYKQLLEQSKQCIQEPATMEKCNELPKQLLYTQLASEGGLQQRLNLNVQFNPVANCGNVVSRQQALPSFMGPKAFFASFINVQGNNTAHAYSCYARSYSSTGKTALMDKRNILDHKRRLLAAKYEIKRVLYKAALRDPNLPRSLWVKFRTKLSKLPRNSSFTRTRNRCILTGRPRAVYRKFRMSRICFRELASKGEIMGVKKASW